jgi:DNA polymerase I-like protein with 3'-5' exonuclease and polymerase domains
VNIAPSDLINLMAFSLGPTGPVALDTETSGLYTDDGARVSTVSVAWEDAEGDWLDYADKYDNLNWATEEVAPGLMCNIVSVAWPFDQGKDGKPEDDGQHSLWPEAENLPEEEWNALLVWLSETPSVIMHNAKFDLAMMAAGTRKWIHGVDLTTIILWDTQNVNHLLWPLRKTSLKPTCAELFGTEFEDESKKVKAYLTKAKLPAGRWDLMPWDIIGKYADMDARITYMLYMRQLWEIENNGGGKWLIPNGTDSTLPVFDKIDRRLRTMLVLLRMEARGLPYDEVESRIAAQECRARAKEVAEQLPFLPTDTHAKAFFFGDGVTSKGAQCLNMVPYSVTEKGSPSLTAEILDRMVADEIPYADVWATYRKASNAASMWYEAYADRMGTDGRLRTCYRQNGTTSTRFSVERVNLQAIPQDYRLSGFSVLDGIPTPRGMIASAVSKMPGWKIYELDLAQAELRVAAMFAGCTTMLDLINEDADLHAVTTQELFNKGPDDPDWGQLRQVGKRGNFSLIFGSGWLTFQQMISKETGLRLQDHQAQAIVTKWNKLYPEFRVAIDQHSTKVAQRQSRFRKGWITLLNGERRWFDQYEETHKAFNQRVQGNLAQFGIDWMLKTDGFLREQGLEAHKAGLILTIHDSQVLLLPDTAEGVAMAAQCGKKPSLESRVRSITTHGEERE